MARERRGPKEYYKMPSNHKNAANIMGAMVHLLTGKQDRHDEFIEKVQLVITGAAIGMLEMMQLSSQFGAKLVPLVVIRPHPAARDLPMIGLATFRDGGTAIYEECYPWLGPKADRIQLIPSGFWSGSFQFADDLSLVAKRTAPKKNYDAAFDGIIRAYNRFNQLLCDQIERGDAFPEAMHFKAA